VFQAITAHRFTGHRGYRVIQQISRVGPTFAAIFIAEIGGIGRFPRPLELICWTGLTPRHRESDTTIHRRPITKLGPPGALGRDRGLRGPPKGHQVLLPNQRGFAPRNSPIDLVFREDPLVARVGPYHDPETESWQCDLHSYRSLSATLATPVASGKRLLHGRSRRRRPGSPW
jgi:hypothetical protein